MSTKSAPIDRPATSAAPLRIAHVIRDGGGTGPVELTVATKLRDRGHRVTVFGPPEVHDHATAAGFDLRILPWSPGTVRAPEDLMPRMIAAAVPWARSLAPVLRTGFDLLVSDCTAFGALMGARLGGTTSAAMMPTVYIAGPRPETAATASGLRGTWAAALTGINRARTHLGLDPVGSVTEQLLDVGKLLVLTSRAFELPEVAPPAIARYVGAQLPRTTGAPAFVPPAGSEPFVLVSLSTSDQGQAGVLDRLLRALETLPVRALVTVGPAVDPARFDTPARIRVQQFVPHDQVLPHADLVITHAGHGTVLAALGAGVPLVCVPMGRDQPAVAARVTHHGLGTAIEPTATTAAMATAIRHVLDDPSYSTAAQRFAKTVEPAGLVVDEIEAMAPSTTTR
ncbi:glycosyltransferase [Amycolatopsis sp. SID8362]|uniref:glycosyltransferase n=1 Tax=Amycolatopsis sp. SID8362 TaxID=2690346 RepID=UPI00136CB632|nr:glycosyltransferase [Amycolatopsis sp. SID8362]NBH07727.1 hypothetical protein [Amycolatopsis sp. SID8362]NED44422.1 glycosyltransferase family 1 protein [Amycolatopsis sp. SID8362]